MAELIAGSVAGAAESSGLLTSAITEVAAAEAELAALIGTETALDAELVIESAGGPIGWIAMAITAGILVAVVLAVVEANNRLQRARLNLGVIQSKMPQPQPQPPTNTSQTPKPPLAPDVVKVLNSIPTGPVVMFSEFYDCDVDNGVLSRCERYRFSHY